MQPTAAHVQTDAVEVDRVRPAADPIPRLDLVVLEVLVKVVGVAEVPAQALAISAATPFSFLGNKLWSFDSGRRA